MNLKLDKQISFHSDISNKPKTKRNKFSVHVHLFFSSPILFDTSRTVSSSNGISTIRNILRLQTWNKCHDKQYTHMFGAIGFNKSLPTISEYLCHRICQFGSNHFEKHDFWSNRTTQWGEIYMDDDALRLQCPSLCWTVEWEMNERTIFLPDNFHLFGQFRIVYIVEYSVVWYASRTLLLRNATPISQLKIMC